MTSIRPDGRVEFRFFRPNALDVKVLGNFNGWSGDSILMSPQGDGWWIANVRMDAGEYRFRYWADHQWYTDFAANGVEPFQYGWNSVLIVPAKMAVKITDAPAGKISGPDDKKGRFVHKTTAKLAA
jgi:1,4-alpha-glucan branching enzyme